MCNLFSDVEQEFVVGLVHAAGEHEVVPQQNPELVGQVVKVVRFVNSSCNLFYQHFVTQLFCVKIISLALNCFFKICVEI